MVKKIPKRFQLKFISCEVANRFQEKAHFQQSLVKIFSIKSKAFIVLIMGIGGGIEMDWAKRRSWYTWVNILTILINTTTSIQSSLSKIVQINRFNLKMTISHLYPRHQEKKGWLSDLIYILMAHLMQSLCDTIIFDPPNRISKEMCWSFKKHGNLTDAAIC